MRHEVILYTMTFDSSGKHNTHIVQSNLMSHWRTSVATFETFAIPEHICQPCCRTTSQARRFSFAYVFYDQIYVASRARHY